jgi:hypothetical protein
VPGGAEARQRALGPPCRKGMGGGNALCRAAPPATAGVPGLGVPGGAMGRRLRRPSPCTVFTGKRLKTSPPRTTGGAAVLAEPGTGLPLRLLPERPTGGARYIPPGGICADLAAWPRNISAPRGKKQSPPGRSPGHHPALTTHLVFDFAREDSVTKGKEGPGGGPPEAAGA